MQAGIGQKFLVVYSGVLTAVFAVTVLSGFVGGAKKQTLTELTVQRINVVEPDGTIRMIVSNTATAPGIIIRNKEHPHPTRSGAGMFFYNEEGSENGGMMFDGRKDADGHVTSSGHLSFDQYEQDQMFVAEAGQMDGQHYSKLVFADNPDVPLTDAIAYADSLKGVPDDEKKQRVMSWMLKHGGAPRRRMVLMRATDGSVAMNLNDTQGRPRIVMAVAPDGTPSLKMLDDKGGVVGQMPTASPR